MRLFFQLEGYRSAIGGLTSPPLRTTSLYLSLGMLHQVGFDETIQIAIHDSRDIRGLIACAVILDTPIIEDVATYLRSPLNLPLRQPAPYAYALAPCHRAGIGVDGEHSLGCRSVTESRCSR